jgi:hypothetical protein
MAAPPPANDPAAPGAVDAVGAAAANAGGVAGEVPPVGLPPPPAVVLPLASPSTISLAIWAKKAEGERAAFSTEEMRNYRLAKEGNNPGALVLTVVTGAAHQRA